jgi:hypothetical protein
MSKSETRKNEEEEAANTRERLFDPASDKPPNEENGNKNDEEKIVEQMVDDQIKDKELSEDDESESSSRIKEEIKEENHQNQQNQQNDEVHGSTVEIVQPADLKPKHLGFTRNLLLAMFAAMIGTGAQFGYALGVMNAPSEVKHFFF